MRKLGKSIHVRLYQESYDWFTGEAERLHMSLSAFTRMYVQEMLTKHGEFKIEYKEDAPKKASKKDPRKGTKNGSEARRYS